MWARLALLEAGVIGLGSGIVVGGADTGGLPTAGREGEVFWRLDFAASFALNSFSKFCIGT